MVCPKFPNILAVLGYLAHLSCCLETSRIVIEPVSPNPSTSESQTETPKSAIIGGRNTTKFAPPRALTVVPRILARSLSYDGEVEIMLRHLATRTQSSPLSSTFTNPQPSTISTLPSSP